MLTRRNGEGHRCAILMSFQLVPRTPQWSGKQKLYSRRPEKTFVVLMLLVYNSVSIRTRCNNSSFNSTQQVITRFVLPAPLEYAERL